MLIYEAKIYNNNNYNTKEIIKINTNYDYKKIQSLYSNLTSLSLLDLYELRANYKKLNYSIIEVDLQLLKIISYPIYLVLMSLFAALIMFRIKNMNSTTFKISIGLFCSVIIYYLNNFFFVLGSTEKLPVSLSIFIPLLLLTLTNIIMLNRINEK